MHSLQENSRQSHSRISIPQTGKWKPLSHDVSVSKQVLRMKEGADAPQLVETGRLDPHGQKMPVKFPKLGNSHSEGIRKKNCLGATKNLLTPNVPLRKK